MASLYNPSYFGSGIFDYDYGPIADAIVQVYQPRTVIDMGCGKGELSKALARKGIEVVAVDGYAEPDFTGCPGITFYKVDLNNEVALDAFTRQLNRRFDLCVSLEVAEHLQPEVSDKLADTLTALADVLVFSAAVPYQDGDGHINCRSRLFWNTRFEKHQFYLSDQIRALLRQQERVGRWYQLNTLDYVKTAQGRSPEELVSVINRLIQSDSAAASIYYDTQKKYELLLYWIKLDVIRWAFAGRNFIKRLLGKTALRLPGTSPFPPEHN